MELTEALQQLNLKKNESTVYIELLQLGLINVGPIIKRTNLHRQLVYEALEGLINEGLATCVTKNGRKHFQARSPSHILKKLEQKKHLATTIVPELLALQACAGSSHLEVRTLYGSSGLCENLEMSVESAARTDKTMRMIGGAPSSDFYKSIGSYYPHYLEHAKKKKVKKQLIAPDDASLEFKKRFANEKGASLRTMKSGLSSPTYTRITKEMVSFEIYADDLVVVQMHNHAIAKGFLEHFELLWHDAVVYTRSECK